MASNDWARRQAEEFKKLYNSGVSQSQINNQLYQNETFAAHAKRSRETYDESRVKKTSAQIAQGNEPITQFLEEYSRLRNEELKRRSEEKKRQREINVNLNKINSSNKSMQSTAQNTGASSGGTTSTKGVDYWMKNQYGSMNKYGAEETDSRWNAMLGADAIETPPASAVEQAQQSGISRTIYESSRIAEQYAAAVQEYEKEARKQQARMDAAQRVLESETASEEDKSKAEKYYEDASKKYTDALSMYADNYERQAAAVRSNTDAGNMQMGSDLKANSQVEFVRENASDSLGDWLQNQIDILNAVNGKPMNEMTDDGYLYDARDEMINGISDEQKQFYRDNYSVLSNRYAQLLQLNNIYKNGAMEIAELSDREFQQRYGGYEEAQASLQTWEQRRQSLLTQADQAQRDGDMSTYLYLVGHARSISTEEEKLMAKWDGLSDQAVYAVQMREREMQITKKVSGTKNAEDYIALGEKDAWRPTPASFSDRTSMAVNPGDKEGNMSDVYLKYMDSSEREVYYALVGQKNYEEAQNYYEAIENRLKQRHAEYVIGYIRDASEENPVFMTGINALMSATVVPAMGIVNIGENISSGGTTGMSSAALASQLNSSVTQGVALNLEGHGLTETQAEFLSGVITSIANNLTQTAFLRFAPTGTMSEFAQKIAGFVPLAVMGTNAATETMNTQLQSGASLEDALGYAAIVGGMEIVTEKIGLDEFLDATGKGVEKTILGGLLSKAGVFNTSNGRALVKTLIGAGNQVLSEAGEEAISEIADGLADIAINGDRSSFYQNYYSYIAQGYDDATARSMASKDFAAQVWESAKAGGVSGAVYGAVGASRMWDNANVVGRGILNADGTAGYYSMNSGTTLAYQMIEDGMAFDDGTITKKIADRLYSDVVENGGQLTEGNISQLYEAMQKDMAGKSDSLLDDTMIGTAGEGALSNLATEIFHTNTVSATTAIQINEVMSAIAHGQDITDAQIKKLNSEIPAVAGIIADRLGADFLREDSSAEAVRSAIDRYQADAHISNAQKKAYEDAQDIAKTAALKNKASEAKNTEAEVSAVMAEAERMANRQLAAEDGANMAQAESLAASDLIGAVAAAQEESTGSGSAISYGGFSEAFKEANASASAEELRGKYEEASRVLAESGTAMVSAGNGKYIILQKNSDGEVDMATLDREQIRAELNDAAGHEISDAELSEIIGALEQDGGTVMSLTELAEQGTTAARENGEVGKTEKPVYSKENPNVVAELIAGELAPKLKSFGINSIVVDYDGEHVSGNENGKYEEDTGTIYLNGQVREGAKIGFLDGKVTWRMMNAAENITFILGHEITHPAQGMKFNTNESIERTNQIIRLYQEYTGMTDDQVKERVKRIQELYQEHENRVAEKEGRAPKKRSYKYAQQEFASDAMGLMLMETNGLRNLSASDRSGLGKQIIQLAKNLRANISGIRLAKGNGSYTDALRVMQRTADDLVKVLDKDLKETQVDRSAQKNIVKGNEADNSRNSIAEGVDGEEVSRYNGNVTEVRENAGEDQLHGASGEGVRERRSGADTDQRVSGGLRDARRGNLSSSGVLLLSEESKRIIEERGAVYVEVHETTEDRAAFSDALDAARKADTRNGWAVSPKSVEELSAPGMRTFMSDGNYAGFAVTESGDIEGVFSNKSAGAPNGVTKSMMPQAIAAGGNKLDCYGIGLVKLYSKYGFEPVARVPFNAEYANDGWDESKGRPDVVIMIHNGDDADAVVKNSQYYHRWTPDELNALPVFEDYDEAMAYRDKILEERNNSNANDIRFSVKDTTDDSEWMNDIESISDDEILAMIDVDTPMSIADFEREINKLLGIPYGWLNDNPIREEQLHEEIADRVFEKSGIEYVRADNVFDGTNQAERAKWSKERIDRLYDEYASTLENYSKAYATYISPENFIALTTTENNRSAIYQQSRSLNTDELRDNTQEIYLVYDPSQPNEIVGHEGRHRMVALQWAGVKSVPITVRFMGEIGKQNRQPISELEVRGQEFRNGRAPGYVTLENLTPISRAYRPEIEERFGAGEEYEGVRFSVSDTFASDLDKWENDGKSSYVTFNVGTTSDALMSIGIESKDLIMRGGKINAILKDHPEITVDILKKIPDILEKPFLIMKSRTVENSIVAYGDVVGENGIPVMVSVLLGPTESGNQLIDVNIVTSAYSRTNESGSDLTKDLILNSDILYVNENGAEEWLHGLGVQFPSFTSFSGPIGIVTYENGVVKSVEGIPGKDVFGTDESTAISRSLAAAMASRNRKTNAERDIPSERLSVDDSSYMDAIMQAAEQEEKQRTEAAKSAASTARQAKVKQREADKAAKAGNRAAAAVAAQEAATLRQEAEAQRIESMTYDEMVDEAMSDAGVKPKTPKELVEQAEKNAKERLTKRYDQMTPVEKRDELIRSIMRKNGALSGGKTVKVSRVATNTFARGDFFQGVRTAAGEDLQSVVEGLATYNPVSEQESVTEAAHRLDTDYVKWYRELPNKEQWSGVDHDTAMMILSQLQKESAGSGDYTEVIRWAKIIQQHGTTAAQALQSFAKYTRTATGIMMKQLDLIDQIAENQKLNDAKKLWLIRQTIDYANLIDRVQEGDKEGLVDVIMRILADRGTKVSKFGKNRFLKQDFQYLSNYAINALASLSDDYRKRGFGEKLSAWQYIAQLGNLRTGIRNITSNTAFYGLESFTNNTVGILADAVVGAITGKRTVGMTWLAKGDKSTWQGMKDRGRASYLQVKYDVSGDESKSKYEGRSSNRTFKIAQKQIIRSNLEMLNGLSLNVSDELFKGATYQSMFNSYARFVADGKLTLEEAIALSEEEMKYRTFQDETLPGFLLNGLHDWANTWIVHDKNGKPRLKQGAAQFGLGDIVVKYRTVPGALIDRAIEFSPLGLVKVIYHTGMLVKSGGQNVLEQREVSMGFARFVTGSALAAVFALLAKNGVLKRKEDEEDKNVAAMEGAEGRTGTQINLSAIGRYLSGDESWNQWREGDALQDIGFLDPIGSSITWGALFNQAFWQNADGFLSSVLGASVGMATSAFTDLSMMDTVNDLIYAVMYRDDSANGVVADLLISFATSFATGLEPSLIRQLAQGLDNNYRDTTATGGLVNQLLGDSKRANELQQMANQVMVNIPGLRQMVPTKLDNLGDEKTYGGDTATNLLNAFLNPGRFNRLSETELQLELKAVYDECGDASFYPDRKAPNSLSFGKDAAGNDVKVTMTYDQKREYLQMVGDTYKEILAETMNDQRYIAASSTEKAEMLKEIKEYSEYRAKLAFNEKNGSNPDWENTKWSKTEAGMDAGFGFTEMRGILSDVGAFESEKDEYGDAKSGSVDDQILDYLNEKSYSDDEKLSLYSIINGGVEAGAVRRLNILMSDSEFTYEYHGESITAQGAGLTFGDAVSVIQEYHKLRAEGSPSSLNEQTEMNRWLKANGYSDEQIEVIGENYKFYGMIPQQEDSTMAKLNAAGIDSDTAYNIAGMLAGLEPEAGEDTVSNAQKYDAILDSRISDAEKQAAIAAVQGKNSMFGDLDRDTASSLMNAYQMTGNTDYVNFNAGEQCTLGGVVYEYTDDQKAAYKETYLSAISTLARGVDVSGSYTNVNGNRTPLIDQIKVISAGYAAAAALRGSGVALTEASVKNNDSLNKYWKVSTAQHAYGISPSAYLRIWAGAQEVNYAGTNADVRDYIKSMVGSGQPYNYMCYALGVSLKAQRLALGYSS